MILLFSYWFLVYIQYNLTTRSQEKCILFPSGSLSSLGLLHSWHQPELSVCPSIET